ncbi:MAG: hypothetical protein LBG19_00975, partial [Prevotellaceae bacterium]|nr:hypothetical protein [Prevotellaceae bacterium]
GAAFSVANLNKNKYLYGGKEYQDEVLGGTLFGLADFEARFLDSRIPRFTSMDPLAEKFYGVSPYAYCLNNPIIFVDRDGRDVNIANLTSKQHQAALGNKLNTKEGRAFIGRYMAEGQSLKVGGRTYTFSSTGDRAKDELRIASADLGKNVLGNNKTLIKGSEKNILDATINDNVVDGVIQVISLDNSLSEQEATYTIGHEAFVHADKDADELNVIDEKVASGAYGENFNRYTNEVRDIGLSGEGDHRALARGLATKLRSYVKQLDQQKNTNYYYKEYEKDVRSY